MEKVLPDWSVPKGSAVSSGSLSFKGTATRTDQGCLNRGKRQVVALYLCDILTKVYRRRFIKTSGNFSNL